MKIYFLLYESITLSVVLFSVFLIVPSTGQRRGDYIITDTRQIPNLNRNEEAALGQLISSLGGQDVEITVIEQQKPQPQKNFYGQPQYGYPNQGRPFVANNRQPQLEIVEVYTNGSPYGNNNYQKPGPPPRGQNSNGNYPMNYGRYPGSNGRNPPPGRFPPTDRFESQDRFPHQENRPPQDRFPSPDRPYGDNHKEVKDTYRPHSHDNRHHHKHHHHHHHEPAEHNPSRRGPPPRPVYDKDDPRVDEDVDGDNTNKLDDDAQRIIYPETNPKEKYSQQHNINLSELNNDEDDEHNVAGYINNFPVIFLNKDEIRR